MAFKYLSKGPFPVWASAPNYQAGPNPWNGNSTKVVPTSGELEQGVVPGVPVDSRLINWALNAATANAGVIAHALMRTWQPYLIKDEATDADTYEIGGYQDSFDVATTNTHVVAPYRTTLGNGLISAAKPMLLACRNLTTSEASVFASGDGSHWSLPLGSVAFDSDVGGGAAHTFDILGDDFNDRDNLYMVSSHDRSITRFMGSLVIGDRDIVADVAPASHGFSCIGCDNVGTLLAGVSQTASTSQRIFRSTDGGATWAPATTPSGWNAIVMHAFCATNSTQADITGAGDVVLATGAIDAEILRSTDQGATWTAVTLPAALASRSSFDAYQLAWSPVFQLFMCVNGDFDVAVSSDGLNWTMRTGSGGLAGVIEKSMLDRGRLLSAAGSCFALAVNGIAVGAGSLFRRGVFYTFDAGFEWHFVDFGSTKVHDTDPPSQPEQLLGLVECGGQLVAYGPGKLFASMPQWSPPADLDMA